MSAPANRDLLLGLTQSVQDALYLAEAWEADPGERRMVAGLLRWLVRAGWVGSASAAAFEVPWRGRRIDLVTINAKGYVSAFEFKLGGTGRVFEQAIYNSFSAHRSFVVSGSRPNVEYQGLARSHGIGLFTVLSEAKLIQRPTFRSPQPALARLLRDQARKRSAIHV